MLNLHTEQEGAEKTSDGEDGNYRYHHSFLVTFQRTRQATPTEGGDETVPTPSKPGSGQPAPVGSEPTPSPSRPTEVQHIATGVNNAAYVHSYADHVEDNSVLKPGERSIKQWVLRNTGTTTWGAGYQLVHAASKGWMHRLPCPHPRPRPAPKRRLPWNFVTHEASTELRSDWRLANPAGQLFGPPVWTIVYAPPAGTADVDATFPPPDDQLIQLSQVTNAGCATASRSLLETLRRPDPG